VARADLLTTLAIFGKLAYPQLDVLGLIGREQMKESKFFEEVLAEGRQEGLQQGRQEGQRELLTAQLEARFGRLSKPVRQRLQSLSGRDLAQLGRAILTASSLRDLGLEK
jgi:predicted transposase YdaD